MIQELKQTVDGQDIKNAEAFLEMVKSGDIKEFCIMSSKKNGDVSMITSATKSASNQTGLLFTAATKLAMTGWDE